MSLNTFFYWKVLFLRINLNLSRSTIKKTKSSGSKLSYFPHPRTPFCSSSQILVQRANTNARSLICQGQPFGPTAQTPSVPTTQAKRLCESLTDTQRQKINKNKLLFRNFSQKTKYSGKQTKKSLLFKLWGMLGVQRSRELVSEGHCIPDNVLQEPPGCCVNEAFQALHTTSLVPLKQRFLEAKLSAGENSEPCAICLSTSLKRKTSCTAVLFCIFYSVLQYT